MHTDLDYSKNPELAIAALIHMLTHVPSSPSQDMARSIISHLTLISMDLRFPQAVRIAATEALRGWRQHSTHPGQDVLVTMH